jgi:ABC-type uncharacterized transport system substrate-binding protein
LDGFASVRFDALLVTEYPIFSLNMKTVLEFVESRHVPAIYPSAEFVARGGFMSFGVDRFEVVDRAAELVAEILQDPDLDRGKPAGKLPFAIVGRTHIGVNTDTAANLGINIPERFRAYATDVYP